MTWRALSRLEFEGLIRSKGLWALATLLTLDFFVLNFSPDRLVREHVGPTVTLGAFQQTFVALLAVGSVLGAFQSIAGERDSGSLKFHLATPASRTDILVGKIVGRTAALCVPIGLLFLVGAIAGIAMYGLFDPFAFFALALVTVWYALLGVSVGTAISAGARTGRNATAGTIGYVVCLLLWVSLSGILSGWVRDYVPVDAQLLQFLLVRVSPTRAYNVVTNALLGLPNSGETWSQVARLEDPSMSASNVFISNVFETTPLLLEPWVSFATFAFWSVIPITFAAVRFRRADLT